MQTEPYSRTEQVTLSALEGPSIAGDKLRSCQWDSSEVTTLTNKQFKFPKCSTMRWQQGLMWDNDDARKTFKSLKFDVPYFPSKQERKSLKIENKTRGLQANKGEYFASAIFKSLDSHDGCCFWPDGQVNSIIWMLMLLPLWGHYVYLILWLIVLLLGLVLNISIESKPPYSYATFKPSSSLKFISGSGD